MNRRGFIAGTVLGLGAGFSGFGCGVSQPAPGAARAEGSPGAGYGPLVSDPLGFIDLPSGFRYHELSRVGETMDDGFLVPGLHDGMAAFPGREGRTILVRNHELSSGGAGSPFGERAELLDRVGADRIYDRASIGGTTTLVYDTVSQTLVGHHLSLVGTVRNCAGGPTPWGSWVTCEESTLRAGDGRQRDHGFAFEVPSQTPGLATPTPLTRLGRFNHEAIAVDPASGIVYETEDRADGLLYRFVPDRPGDLRGGGRLQALAIRALPGADTSNNDGEELPLNEPLEVAWIDLDNVEAPDDDLRAQGASRGAARFARGEGIWHSSGLIYFAATSGGRNLGGQIWRYLPSPAEGAWEEAARPGTIELFSEPNDSNILDMPDNIAMAPFGDLILCEDGREGNFVRGLTGDGQLYPIARNVRSRAEFAGAVFSPDGSTLFVNVQGDGVTLAITGPWT